MGAELALGRRVDERLLFLIRGLYPWDTLVSIWFILVVFVGRSCFLHASTLVCVRVLCDTHTHTSQHTRRGDAALCALAADACRPMPLPRGPIHADGADDDDASKPSTAAVRRGHGSCVSSHRHPATTTTTAPTSAPEAPPSDWVGGHQNVCRTAPFAASGTQSIVILTTAADATTKTTPARASRCCSF